ncbi:hypothetical protein KUV26_03620 [Leisingera daeponensis]|uniref:Uncharacterized protein n=1 Tax=Leisingera daeponensis TaxID=405746 RepID=A0ABS7NBD2_9RHOB|nr:hypothetical protein [Leisingera daeponensis]MBY6138514.1 hypothetical protein [Leisingera daeponensis]
MMLSLRSMLTGAGVAALAAAVWWLVQLTADRETLRAELAAVHDDLGRANANLARANEAARVHRAHLARAAEQAWRWDALARDLQSMEGRDAPLSPFLRAAAERLYGPER